MSRSLCLTTWAALILYPPVAPRSRWNLSWRLRAVRLTLVKSIKAVLLSSLIYRRLRPSSTNLNGRRTRKTPRIPRLHSVAFVGFRPSRVLSALLHLPPCSFIIPLPTPTSNHALLLQYQTFRDVHIHRFLSFPPLSTIVLRANSALPPPPHLFTQSRLSSTMMLNSHL